MIPIDEMSYEQIEDRIEELNDEITKLNNKIVDLTWINKNFKSKEVKELNSKIDELTAEKYELTDLIQ